MHRPQKSVAGFIASSATNMMKSTMPQKRGRRRKTRHQKWLDSGIICSNSHGIKSAATSQAVRRRVDARGEKYVNELHDEPYELLHLRWATNTVSTFSNICVEAQLGSHVLHLARFVVGTTHCSSLEQARNSNIMPFQVWTVIPTSSITVHA